MILRTIKDNNTLFSAWRLIGNKSRLRDNKSKHNQGRQQGNSKIKFKQNHFIILTDVNTSFAVRRIIELFMICSFIFHLPSIAWKLCCTCKPLYCFKLNCHGNKHIIFNKMQQHVRSFW